MKELYREKIGDALKKRREEKGLTYEKAAADLKINPTYLDALETGDIEKTPALVFFKGFLKNYGDYLGFDGKKLVEILSQEILNEKSLTPVESKEDALKEEHRKKIFVYSFLTVIALIIIFSWVRVSHVNYEKNIEIEKRKSTNFNTLTTTKEIALHEEKKRIIGEVEKLTEKDLIIIKASKDCWVEAVFEGNKIYQGLLLQGDKKELPFKRGMKIKFGNVGGVELIVKGEIKKDLGKDGEVKEIYID